MEATAISVEDRLERIEGMLESIVGMVNQAPPMVSMIMDTVDESISKANESIPVQERIDAAKETFDKISQPDTLKGINQLLEMMQLVPGLTAMAADSMDEMAYNVNQSTHGFQDRIDGLSRLLMKLSDPTTVAKLEQLIELSDQIPGLIAMVMDSVDEVAMGTDLMGPQNMELLKSAMKANQYANSVPPAKVGGLFSLLGILRDKEVQKMLGFMVNFAKAFGRELNIKNY